MGLRAQAEYSANRDLGELWRPAQGEAGLSEGNEDGEGPFGVIYSVYSLKGTGKQKPKAP